MPKTITARNMWDQVYEALGDENPNFDITAIVDDLQREFGTVDVNLIPSEPFWEIVSRHYIDAC